MVKRLILTLLLSDLVSPNQFSDFIVSEDEKHLQKSINDQL